MHNGMLEKLRASRNVVGTFFESGSMAVAEILGLAGLDYILIDTEHAPYTLQEVSRFITAAEVRGVTPMVRVKDTARSTILRTLDIGAKGLVIPAIKTVEEVEKVLEYAKYYPAGQRGAYFPRASDFGMKGQLADIEAHFINTNNQLVILPQCETRESVDCIDEIVALDGVDGVFIGPYDLSIALGKPAAFTDPAVAGAFDKALAACKKHDKYCFTYAPNTQTARGYFDKGYRGACISSDTIEIGKAYAQMVGEFLK